MKKLISAIGLSLLSFGAIADDHAPNMAALETYGCTYNEDKDLNDLLSLSKKWDRFASKNFSMPYQGYVLTPFYMNANSQADVYWVGVSPSFEAQGTTQREERIEGESLNAEFSEVLNCSSHGQWGMRLVMESDEEVPEQGVVSFQACTLKEGVTPAKINAADEKMNAVRKKMGFTGNITRWFLFSSRTDSFTADFLEVSEFESLSQRGEIFDTAIKNGMGQTYNSLYGDLMECQNTGTSLYVSVGGKD